MPEIKGKLTTWTPYGQKHPHLMVKIPGKNEWESIAIIKVPLHEFWQKLGLGMGLDFLVISGSESLY